MYNSIIIMDMYIYIYTWHNIFYIYAPRIASIAHAQISDERKPVRLAIG